MKNNQKNLIMSSIQITLMSTGVLSIAFLLFMSMPNILNSAASADIPSFFSTLRSWLRPPYLYFIINAIIITIVATSRLHHNHHINHHDTPPAVPTTKLPNHSPHHHQHDVISVHTDQFSSPYNGVVSVVDNVIGAGYYNDVVSVKDVDVVEEREKRVVSFDEDVVVIKGRIPVEEESTVVESSTWTPLPSSSPLMRHEAVKKSPDFFYERPPASARFGTHRRPAKTKPTTAEGGKALKVSKPKKHDTLDSTWKTITEGRHIPLTSRHHKTKSETTWEIQDRQIDLLDDSFPTPAMMKKSETFNDHSDYMPQPPPPLPPVGVAVTSKLKKEPSLGHDELNRRVEAFINKFNEEMKLQRQQSMQQFMEMINRAA